MLANLAVPLGNFEDPVVFEYTHDEGTIFVIGGELLCWSSLPTNEWREGMEMLVGNALNYLGKVPMNFPVESVGKLPTTWGALRSAHL